MEKKTVFAVLLLIILGGVALFVMRAPEKGDRVGDKPRPLPEIKAANIAALEITQPGGTDKVTLAKKGEKWHVTSPYDKPADQAAVKSAVEALEKIKWGDISTQQKDRHADLEVSDAKATHVIAKDSAGTVLADLYLGKAAGSSTMVRIAGKDEVWQAGDFYTSSFKKEGKAWREHAIFDLKADDAQKVTLQGGGEKVVLERIPAPAAEGNKPAANSIFEAKWKVTEGQVRTLKPGVELDSALVNRLIQGLASLRAGDFLDNAKPEDPALGLAPGAPGQIEVQVGFKDGPGLKTAGVRIGAQKGEDYHVQALDSPQVFTVKKWGAEQLAHLPSDLGDKSLISLKADQIDAVTVQQDKEILSVKAADKTWKADKLADADEAKLKAIAEGFDNVSGASFIPQGAPELASLVKPRATVTVKPKTGAPIVIKIGDARGDDVAVQKAGQEPMWLKKYQVDRILKKPADVAKDKGNPPAAPAH
jgi:hypothetical protein